MTKIRLHDVNLN